MLKKILMGGMLLLSIDSYSQCNNDYQLFWSDEFELTGVDLDKWVPQQGGGGFGNQEVQYYKPENATVSDGQLHIKLANETVVDGSTTYNYTSAKLQTLSKVSFQYGRVEAKIKMPDAVGSWPAFWMMGANIGEVGWPVCGEIDIMEWVGRGPDAVSGSIFFEGTWPDNHLSTLYNIPSGQSFITDFHTFAVEWEPNQIRYYCDNNLYATYKNTSIAPKNWYFNHDFYIILNSAIGGTGGGTVNFTAPQYMDIEYVRVYSLPTTADHITVSGPKHLMENTQNVLYTTSYFPNTTYDWSLPAGATIVDGAGTNAIHVNFTTTSGDVSVTANNTCGTLTDALAVTLLADACTIMYDNFDDTRIVDYSSTGTLTEEFTNPLQDAINASTGVAKYERNVNETYDVLGINDIALETALDYENGSKVFFMDLLTDAAVGTQITLQLENSALNAGAYPQGRRSSYIGYVAQQNEWHTIRFNYNQIISSATAANQVDHIALLFDPGHQTGNVYYFDNFRRMKDASGCPPLVTAVTDPQSTTALSIYPNPVNNTLNIDQNNENKLYAVYNHLGEKILESSEQAIDVSHLPAGMYFLKTEKRTVKFIKQ